jgi:arylformamidase
VNLEAEYDNRARVADHPVIIAQWKGDAARFRASTPHEADVAYGGAPRHRVDIFTATGAEERPLMVFIHGGYWRAFDKSFFSHMAAGILARGYSVAVPSYTLCPEVSIAEIIEELRALCLFLHRRTGHRLVVTGHSAGGHLAACMAATDWADRGAPADLVIAGISISGLFD